MNASGRALRATGAAAAVAALAFNLVWGARIYSRETPPADRDDAYEKIALFTRVLEQLR